MNVYLVERTDHKAVGYDEWDAIVVVAESEEQALEMGPGFKYDEPHPTLWAEEWMATPRKARLIGTGAEGPRRTVLSSFNAG